MKRWVLLFLLISLSACTSYPDTEVFTCEIDPYNMFGDYTVMGTYSAVLTAKRGYITEEAITIEIPITESLEAWIQREFEGDRKAFSKRLTSMYRNDDGSNFETLGFIEKDGLLMLNDVRTSKPLPDGWRSWIIPSERNMEQIKTYYRNCN